MKKVRKTKIICTIGPASRAPEILGMMMDAGMDVARLNFSHGTHEDHKQTLDTVKALRREKRRPVAAMLDTKGPEIRLGTFEDGSVTLEQGGEFILYCHEHEGDASGVSITFEHLWKDVVPGNTILIDDGLVELRVISVDKGCICCEIVNGGMISNRKGVNVPGVAISMPYMSDRDRQDILFAIEQDFDYIAASFVRNAGDVMQVRELLHENGGADIKIIAKIENADGVKNLNEILHVSDGIMVARGDMGVEIAMEELPSIQKKLISMAYRRGKVVITATQMLESMISNPRPTRAEATDVANAIYDGTSAIMLSGETAAGKYPVRAVETMARIALRTEQDVNYRKRFQINVSSMETGNVTNAISHATCMTAFDLNATAIVTVTMSGRTARNISKFRPDIPIIGCTSVEKAYRQLAMSWGVIPAMIPVVQDLDSLFDLAVKEAQHLGYVENGDLVVITTGVPLGVDGTTNLLKVHIAGDVLVMGHGIGSKPVQANLCVAKNEAEALQNFKDNDILVIDKTSNKLLPILKRASGIVCEEGGLQSHAAIVGLTLEIPVLIGAQSATNVLKNGTIVLLDAQRGVVCSTSSTRSAMSDYTERNLEV